MTWGNKSILAVFVFLAGIMLSPHSVLGAPPDADAYEAMLRADIARCAELAALRQLAKKHGVRLWLYGGSAAAYAQKARARLTAGDTTKTSLGEMIDEHQDFDLVLDGAAEKIRAFQAEMHDAHPTFGSKDFPFDLWSMHDIPKVPPGAGASLGQEEILSVFSFGGQHTDTASIGLIEITTPKRGQSVVRDLEPPASGRGEFFETMRTKELRYKYSPTHAESKLALEGRNPSVMSVIRYFTKIKRYGFTSASDDLAKLRRAVGEWDGALPRDTMASVKMFDKLRKMKAYLGDTAASVEGLRDTNLVQRLDEMRGLAMDRPLTDWIENLAHPGGRAALVFAPPKEEVYDFERANFVRAWARRGTRQAGAREILLEAFQTGDPLGRLYGASGILRLAHDSLPPGLARQAKDYLDAAKNGKLHGLKMAATNELTGLEGATYGDRTCAFTNL